nr:hypothetical protein [Tanacetum cinerariifolium]
MSWFSRCSWCEGPFNSGNCRHCTNVSFGDELVYDSNPNSYTQTLDFSNPLPHHNYETDSRSSMGAAFLAEFVKLQQNIEKFMDQQICSYCGIPFNGGNYLSCSIVGAENEFAANLSTHTPEPLRHFNSICYDDDDDDVIKSSVEDFVPIPSESEDTSGSDSECDLPSYDDFSPINVPKGKSVTFSNPLFDLNDDFTSSDDESLSDEDVPEDNVLEDIESKDSYDSNLDDPALLVTPLFDSNEDEYFNSGGDVDEINAFVIPLDFKDGYYDSKGEVLYLESFVSDDTIPNLPPEVFLGFDWFKIGGGDPRVQRDGMGGCQRSRVWIEAEDAPPRILEPSADCYK